MDKENMEDTDEHGRYRYGHRWIFFSHKMKETLICDKVDELWWHYAKINHSDKERQILYDFIYMWTLILKYKFILIGG